MEAINSYKKEVLAKCAKNIDHAKLDLAQLIKQSKRAKHPEGKLSGAQMVQAHLEAIQQFSTPSAKAKRKPVIKSKPSPKKNKSKR